jgi:hypothetical protein
MPTPIYHHVAADLDIYPLHMALHASTHQRFMTNHHHPHWIDHTWNTADPTPLDQGWTPTPPTTTNPHTTPLTCTP